MSLILTNFHGLLNQAEVDLCVIEGIASLFDIAVKEGSDGFLPLRKWSVKYGNTIINIEDHQPPSYRMTYRTIVTALRYIALFASQYGYVDMQFEVWDKYDGHVGDGEIGEIIPGRLAVPNATFVREDK